jgi:hypothetical protein
LQQVDDKTILGLETAAFRFVQALGWNLERGEIDESIVGAFQALLQMGAQRRQHRRAFRFGSHDGDGIGK